MDGWGWGLSRGWWGMTQTFPQEQFELCSVNLQTEGTGRPASPAWHTDYLGFPEAMAYTWLGL